MALTHCKECKMEVSDIADSCPKCGYTGIKKDRKQAEIDAVMATTGGKVAYLLILALIFWGVYAFLNPNSDKKKESYAALSSAHKKLADDCMEWTDYKKGDLVILAIENPFSGETRITLNTDQGSFDRCDYNKKTGKRIKAERILNGNIAHKF